MGAFNNNRQQSSHLPTPLLCGSALQRGRNGEGALRAFWFTILACCTSEWLRARAVYIGNVSRIIFVLNFFYI